MALFLKNIKKESNFEIIWWILFFRAKKQMGGISHGVYHKNGYKIS